MDWATSEIVTVLAFLLPGLVAAAVFYSLTAHSRPNDLGLVVQALAFTVAAQAITWIVLALTSLAWEVDSWPSGVETVFSVFCAIFLALVMAWLVNHDFAHNILRFLEITRETSYPSEWYGAFAENDRHYVVLHLKNGNRLYGWPEKWPSRPDQGHFQLSECEWLVDDERRDLTGVSVLLVPAQTVDMIEFIRAGQSEVRGEE